MKPSADLFRELDELDYEDIRHCAIEATWRRPYVVSVSNNFGFEWCPKPYNEDEKVWVEIVLEYIDERFMWG